MSWQAFERHQVLIGADYEARRYAQAHGLPEQVRVATEPGHLWGLRAEATHLVLLPTYQDLKNHWLLQVEVRLLERRGATVEWVTEVA